MYGGGPPGTSQFGSYSECKILAVLMRNQIWQKNWTNAFIKLCLASAFGCKLEFVPYLDYDFYVVHSHVGPTVCWGAPGQCLSCNLRLQYLEETTTADIDKATVYITCFQPGVGIDEADLGVFIKYTTLVIIISEHHIPESQD